MNMRQDKQETKRRRGEETEDSPCLAACPKGRVRARRAFTTITAALAAACAFMPLHADEPKPAVPVPAPAAKPTTAAPPASAPAIDNSRKPIPRPDPAGYWLAPRAFRAAADKVMPSLVTIETFGGVRVAGGPAPKGPPNPNRPGQPRPPQRGMAIGQPGEGPTTGLIVGSDGYIITSTFNFIRKPDIITVVLRDGSQHVAKLLGRDETRKICLLKIEPTAGTQLPVPAFADARNFTVGQYAISLGVGYGDSDPALSAGIISAKNRISGKAVQTDANISPANYGGPLIDIEGKVIGICVPLSPQGGGDAAGVEWYDSGIGFAIPLSGLDKLIDQMKQGKNVYPGRMGVQPGPTQGGKPGVVVTLVQPKTAAEKAGVKVGDIITAIDGEKIQDGLHLRTVMGKYLAGETIKVTIDRAGKTEEISITLDSGNPDVDNPLLPPPTPKPKVEEKPGAEEKPKSDKKPGDEVKPQAKPAP